MISTAALASPAVAQEVITTPGYCAQFYPNANCQNKGPGNPYTDDDGRHMAYHQDRLYHDRARHRGWRHSWHDERQRLRAVLRKGAALRPPFLLPPIR